MYDGRIHMATIGDGLVRLSRLLSLPNHIRASEMFVNLGILSFWEPLREIDYNFMTKLQFV